MPSSSLDPTKGSIRTLILATALAALALGGYLLAARVVYRIGFPLDDAWIHQTYARNLAERGEWAFLPGRPSAGSTAPLWSALLALGYWLRLAPLAWAFGLGAAGLLAVGWAGRELFKAVSPGQARWGVWAALFLIFEWHLVWAAGSGMETLAAALLANLVLALCLHENQHWALIGALIGLSAWIRPDGITLLGPAVWVLYFNKTNWRWRAGALLRLAAGTALVFLPYLVFNRWLAGAWWPNTFFAKQAEYAVLRQASWVQRFIQQAGLPLIGAGIVLLPGFVLFIYRCIHKRRWPALAAPLWMIGYLLLYSWRLPVVYQHGRYIIPCMPVYFVCGMAGMAGWLQINSHKMGPRVLSRVWLMAAASALLAFYIIGARAYAMDVAVIESEMVATAHWIALHTEPDALIAAHDIGALGYFGGRDLIDLAGLVSPEVISFIRDEVRLASYLDKRGAQYLMTFPEWYPFLSQQGELVFSTQAVFSPRLGGENMAVYRWIGQSISR